MTASPGSGVCASCDGPARLGDLMCRPCWSRVTPPTRNDHYDALRRYHAGKITLAELRYVQDIAVRESRI